MTKEVMEPVEPNWLDDGFEDAHSEESEQATITCSLQSRPLWTPDNSIVMFRPLTKKVLRKLGALWAVGPEGKKRFYCQLNQTDCPFCEAHFPHKPVSVFLVSVVGQSGVYAFPVDEEQRPEKLYPQLIALAKRPDFTSLVLKLTTINKVTTVAIAQTLPGGDLRYGGNFADKPELLPTAAQVRTILPRISRSDAIRFNPDLSLLLPTPVTPAPDELE